MKKGFAIVVVVGMCLIAQNAFAQCNPKSTMIPAFEIRGNLLCPDGSTPLNVTLDWFKVDGVICASDNLNFNYPFSGAGTYQLQFWLDNTVDHEFQVCVTTQCNIGGNTVNVQGGFSADGMTPGDCNAIADFPTGSSAVLAHIVTPVQLSSFTSTAQ
jgi:hypothetical protein